MNIRDATFGDAVEIAAAQLEKNTAPSTYRPNPNEYGPPLLTVSGALVYALRQDGCGPRWQFTA